MKPYTLEWWMDRLFEAETKLQKADHYRNERSPNSGSWHLWNDEAKKFKAICTFIYLRIIKKYGEKK